MIQGILPPELIMSGQQYDFLKDMKDLSSYEEKKIKNQGTEIKVDSAHVIEYLNLRSSLHSLNLDFWTIIKDIHTQSKTSENKNSYIGLNYLYFEADPDLLYDEVPNIFPYYNPDDSGSLVFNDWTFPGQSAQPYAINNIDERVVIRVPNTGPADLISGEVLDAFLQFETDSNRNVKLLVHSEFVELMKSPNYYGNDSEI